MTAIINGVMVSGSPEEIKRLIDMYKQVENYKRKIIEDYFKNSKLNFK